MVDRRELSIESERLLDAGDALDALRGFVELFASDSGDVHAWYQTARALLALGKHEQGASALAAVGEAFMDSGNLPMALLSERRLMEHDPRTAATLLGRIVDSYCAGSSRIAGATRAPPPMPAPISANQRFAEATEAQVFAAAEEALGRARLAARGWTNARVRAWPLFSELDANPFRELCELMEFRALTANSVVVDEGDAARSFYIVARGTLRATRGNDTLGMIRAGAFFGEMALLTRSPRHARVMTDTRVEIFELGVEAVEQLGERSQAFAKTLATYCRKRLLENLARTSAVLRALPEPGRHDLLARFTASTHAAGETLLTEGQLNDQLAVLLTGEVEILRTVEGEVIRVATLTTGDVFGEISLISRRPATATVRTLERSVVLRLSRADFDDVVSSTPQLLADLYRLSREREASNEQWERPVGEVTEDALL